MSNEVSVGASAGLPANIGNMAAALAQSVASAGAANNGEAYMKFTKGEWSFGAEETEVEADSIWAVNPVGFMHGWIAWNDKKRADGPKGERLVPATQPMPLESDLPEVDGDWSKCVAMQMRCTNGEDEGIQVLFKTNSHGGRKAYAGLMQEIIKQLGEDPEHPVPLVTLGADSYKHKEHGKVYNPVITVTGWATMAAEPETETDVADEVKPELEPAEEPVAEQPRRRRRKAS